MDILITPEADTPIYQQIEENIKRDILSNQLKENSLLPSIRQLAIDLKVSVITVKKAYEELESQGFLYAYPGKGFFVAEMSDEKKEAIKRKIAETTLKKQIDYLKSLGIKEEEIIRIFRSEQEKNKD